MAADNDEKHPLDSVYGIVHIGDVTPRYTVLKTPELQEWLDGLPLKTKSIVLARFDKIAVGHFGDWKRFDGLLEFRWKNGNRVYGFFWGSSIVIGVYGGTKHGQDRDIKKAKKIRDEVLDGTRTLLKP